LILIPLSSMAHRLEPPVFILSMDPPISILNYIFDTAVKVDL